MLTALSRPITGFRSDSSAEMPVWPLVKRDSKDSFTHPPFSGHGAPPRALQAPKASERPGRKTPFVRNRNAGWPAFFFLLLFFLLLSHHATGLQRFCVFRALQQGPFPVFLCVMEMPFRAKTLRSVSLPPIVLVIALDNVDNRPALDLSRCVPTTNHNTDKNNFI